MGIGLLSYYFLRLSDFNNSQFFLKIIDEATGETLIEVEADTGDRLTFHWIHSVEHISWIEYFTIDDQNHLRLEKIEFQGFGAGIPHDKGKEVIVEDGYIIMKDLGEVRSSYDWINSHTATKEILLNDKKIAEGKDLPHHGYMKMVIQER